MANFLQFDNAGIITIPTAVATGDFSIEFFLFEAKRTGTQGGILAGSPSATTDFIFYSNQNRFTTRIAGTGLDSALQAITEGLFVKGRIERAGNVTRIFSNDVQLNQSTGQTGPFTIGMFGAYNNGQIKYSGQMYGYIHMIGFGAERYYDIANSSGTTLVDTISGQNGTLSGFTAAGGFKEAIDNVPPVITLLGDNPLTVVQGQPFVEPGFTAIDDVDGDITGNVVVTGSVDTSTAGDYSLNYDVMDGAGNQAITRTRIIQVIAQVNNAPVITLFGANPFTVTQGGTYVEPGFEAVDEEDGNITGSVIVTGSVNPSVIGQYTLNYSVTDSGGLISQASRVVNVVAAAELVNVTSPVNFASKQRNENGQATFTLSGTYSTAQIFEYSVNAGSTWSDINATASTSFSTQITVTGQVDILVRVKNNAATQTTRQKITAAMAICIAPAQSNGSGRLTNNQVVTLNPGAPVPTMYKNGQFLALQDPTGEEAIATGSIWPLVVSVFANNGIPVCLHNPAVGGTTISQWQPGSSRHNKILTFANLMGGLEKLFTLIGESDAQISTPKETFKSSYISSVLPVYNAYNCDVHAIYFPVGSSLNANPTRPATIRAAYDELIAENEWILFGGDLGQVDISGGDGLHLKTDQHAIDAALVVYEGVTGEQPPEPVINSRLNMTLTGIPNGQHQTRIVNPATGVVLLNELVTWNNGAANRVFEIPVGTVLEYYAIGTATGGLNRAATTAL